MKEENVVDRMSALFVLVMNRMRRAHRGCHPRSEPRSTLKISLLMRRHFAPLKIPFPIWTRSHSDWAAGVFFFFFNSMRHVRVMNSACSLKAIVVMGCNCWMLIWPRSKLIKVNGVNWLVNLCLLKVSGGQVIFFEKKSLHFQFIFRNLTTLAQQNKATIEKTTKTETKKNLNIS